MPPTAPANPACPASDREGAATHVFEFALRQDASVLSPGGLPQRLEMHPADHALVQRAASLQKLSVGEFVLLAAYSQARDYLSCCEEDGAWPEGDRACPQAGTCSHAPSGEQGRCYFIGHGRCLIIK